MANGQFPIGDPPALAARPAHAFQVSPSTPRAFTLVEILVAVALLSVIVLGLFAMFNQTQRAFRLGMTQSDILEAGRAVTEILPRQLEQMVPAGGPYPVGVNFYTHYYNRNDKGPIFPLTQSLPGTTVMRTNLLQDCFLLLRQNQTWVGIGYCVRNADTNGLLWLPQSSADHMGVGSLYCYMASTNAVGRNGLRQDPSVLYTNFLKLSVPGKPASTNITIRICDGVVHFRLRAFATNGFPLFSDGLHTNACFRTNSLTLGYTIVRQTWVEVDRAYPDNLLSIYCWSNAVPGALEMELGLLEQRAWERYNSIGDENARLAYLQRDDTSSRVHLFRQRIPIRNVDPSPYQ